VLDESEIVTEKIVVASDRLQPDRQAEEDEDGARRYEPTRNGTSSFASPDALLTTISTR